MVRFVPFAATAVAGLLASAFLAGSALAQAFTVEDMTGRPLEFDKPAERVITIPIPGASIVIAVDGGTARLVGMHESSMQAVLESILGEFFPEAKQIASDVVVAGSPSGFAPNVESIAALNPDLVVQWGNRGEDLTAPLDSAGIRTGLILYGNEQQARDMIAFLGAATGNSERVEVLNGWRDRTETAITTALSGLADTDKPKVLYLLRARESLTAAGNNTYNDYYIRLAGGVNAAAEIDGQKPVNVEQIAAWNPDVILLNNFESGLDLSPIYNDPILSQTAAARDKRVYRMPMGGYRWDPPSQESPLTWMWLAEVLHPDQVEFDLRGEIKSSYETLYAHVPSEEQIDGILHFGINGESAGYDAFAAR